MSVLRQDVDLRCKECWRVWVSDSDERPHAYWIDIGPEEKLLFDFRGAPSGSSARDAS
jgi:hypothetical protein